MKKNNSKFIYIVIVNFIMLIIYFMIIKNSYLYFKVVDWFEFIICILLFLVPTYFAIVNYFLIRNYKIKRFNIFLIINIISFVFCFISLMLVNIFKPFYSETKRLNNYLNLDSHIDVSFFPSSIFDSSFGVDYHYRYEGIRAYELYLELEMTEENFISEKKRIEQLLDGKDCKTNSLYYSNSIDYIIVDNNYYDVKFHGGNYFYYFVSFSNDKYKIRYVYAFARDSINQTIPYFILKSEI